jgi:hypothetical protein
MMRFFTWKRLLLAVVLLLILGIVGFVVWASNPLAPMADAQAALITDAQVEVQTDQWLVFEPEDQMPTTGFIFYPGGRVDARAYAPYMHAIADQGYLAIIVPMPLNLAIFGLDQASAVINKFPEIQHWAIGGHSLGGSMAARFVQSNPSLVDGLVFWASYPDIDLSALPITVTSIYGTQDGVANLDTIKNSASFLPADAIFVPIEGGNHAQFGWYGDQPGDNAAAISRDEQQAQTVQATVDVLAKIGNSAAPDPASG